MMLMDKVEYSSYNEIPPLIKDMIRTVSGERNIEKLPLEDINGFIQGVLDFDADKVDILYEAEDETDGWAL